MMIDVERLEIPPLDGNPALQLLTLPKPVVPYGSVARGSIMEGTFHFYTDDSKFTRLFARPERILSTCCTGCIEPNPSTGPGVPMVAALFGIYRKRAVARFWQDAGIPISVDLSVDESVLPFALIGVPAGWRSYAVRSHRHHDLAWIERRHDLAVAHAGDDAIMFIVVGGGKIIRKECEARGWIQVPEHCRISRHKLQLQGA